jgi:NADH-quinone oxidoreductase subunit B
MAVDESRQNFTHPIYGYAESIPGADLFLTKADEFLTWGLKSAMWVFPMATSCCGIEFMAAACSRFDMDRIGSIARGTPRQCDVMIIAGTITVKMAPRVKRLWDQMPEPKWAIAMGSCAISGDFYRDIYSVVPGVDTFMPVDVYVPGCPPNPDDLLMGMRRLQEKITRMRDGTWVEPVLAPNTPGFKRPEIRRINDPDRDPQTSKDQLASVLGLGLGGEAVRVPKSES